MKQMIVAALAALFACSASAQEAKCLPRAVFVEDLRNKYNERLSGGGPHNPQQLLEAWVLPESGSFTVFITRADGLACVMATGKHWQSNEPRRDQRKSKVARHRRAPSNFWSAALTARTQVQ